MPTVAINGLGRIGRAALKILLDEGGELDLVAVNDVADADNLAYLLRYDTVYGRYHRQVSAGDGALIVDGKQIQAFTERDPAALPWRDLGVDLVLECTGGATAGADRAGGGLLARPGDPAAEHLPDGVARRHRQAGGDLREVQAHRVEPGRPAVGRAARRRLHRAAAPRDHVLVRGARQLRRLRARRVRP